MNNISLLPSRYRQYQESIRKRSNYTLIGGAVVVFLFIIYSAACLISIFPRDRLQSLQTERVSLESQIKPLEKYEVWQNTTTALEQLAVQAVGTTPEWRSIVLNIGESVPENVWLSTISGVYTDKAGDAKIVGWATTYNDISQWLEQLKKVPGISDPRCSLSAETTISGSKAVQFEIRVSVLQGKGFQLTERGENQDAK